MFLSHYTSLWKYEMLWSHYWEKWMWQTCCCSRALVVSVSTAQAQPQPQNETWSLPRILGCSFHWPWSVIDLLKTGRRGHWKTAFTRVCMWACAYMSISVIKSLWSGAFFDPNIKGSSLWCALVTQTGTGYVQGIFSVFVWRWPVREQLNLALSLSLCQRAI